MTKSGIDPEEMASMFGAAAASGTVNMRQYLALEKDNVVIPGRITEAIYIGTDTRYLVDLSGQAELVVRLQNYGSRYDLLYGVGDEVIVHWAAENAQVLTE